MTICLLSLTKRAVQLLLNMVYMVDIMWILEWISLKHLTYLNSVSGGQCYGQMFLKYIKCMKNQFVETVSLTFYFIPCNMSIKHVCDAFEFVFIIVVHDRCFVFTCSLSNKDCLQGTAT